MCNYEECHPYIEDLASAPPAASPPRHACGNTARHAHTCQLFLGIACIACSPPDAVKGGDDLYGLEQLESCNPINMALIIGVAVRSQRRTRLAEAWQRGLCCLRAAKARGCAVAAILTVVVWRRRAAESACCV